LLQLTNLRLICSFPLPFKGNSIGASVSAKAGDCKKTNGRNMNENKNVILLGFLYPMIKTIDSLIIFRIFLLFILQILYFF
jgi:hypothetical protein